LASIATARSCACRTTCARSSRLGRAEPSGSLATELIHVAVLGRAAAMESVSGRLGSDGAQQDCAHGVDAAAGTDRALHVELVVVQQAEMKLAVRRQAHAIAGAAIRFADGADEADNTPRAGWPEVLRLVGGVLRRKRRERPERALDPPPRIVIRDELPARNPGGIVAAERHGLDE